MTKKLVFIIMVMAFIAAGIIPLGFADVIVHDNGATTTTTASTWSWHAADTPIGTLFYFLGEVVAFPFRLIGGLF
jgi:hypothetical protein